MKSFQILILFPSLFFLLVATDDPYSYLISHGFYTTPMEEQPHIYTESTPHLFEHVFTFLKPTDYSNSLYHMACNKTKLRTNATDYAGCLLEPEIYQIISYLDSRLDTLKASFTGSGYIINHPIPFDHNLANVPEIHNRPGRQVIAAAAVAGSYLGYKIYDYFHSSSNSDAIYSELTKGMDSLQAGLVQQSHALIDLSHYTDHKISNIVSKFNAMISVAETNTQNEEIHYKSL